MKIGWFISLVGIVTVIFKERVFEGYTEEIKRGKWSARLKIGKIYKYLGRFSTLIAAVDAYNRAAQEVHQEFYRDTTKEKI